MSDLASAISALSATGLEAYEVSTGAPVSVSTSTVGGVPVTSVSVGSLLSGSSGTLIIIIALVVVGLLFFFFYKKG